jgi:hypothetical protein
MASGLRMNRQDCGGIETENDGKAVASRRTPIKIRRAVCGGCR